MSWVESLIERVLAHASARARLESPRACQILAELSGKRLAIQVNGTPWERQPLLLESTGQALTLRPAHAADSPDTAQLADAAPNAEPAAALGADAMIIGAPLSLLALTRADPQALIGRADVRVVGDAQLAERFGELGMLLAPDLEQSLAQVIGRSAAHVLLRSLRAAADSARSAAATSVRNLAEYLAHESGDLVSRQQAAHVLRGVELAREQLDRLEARLTRVQQRARSLAGGSEPS